MILAINTSTMQYSMALVEENGSVAAEYLSAGGKGRFARLLPVLEFMLKTSETPLSRIRCVAVALGPGSFTGLRVGLSMAKGLCHALKLPMAGISSLAALAAQVGPSEHVVAPLLDSRRGEFFSALFEIGQTPVPRRLTPDRSLRPADLDRFITAPTLFVGNDFKHQAPLVKTALDSRAILAPPQHWNLRASSVAALGLSRFEHGDLDEPQSLSPVYLRPPEIRPAG